MKGTFEFKLRNGSTCTIEANYECTMKTRTIYADGWDIPGESKPMDSIDNKLVAYVDRKIVDSSHDHNFWGVIDAGEGIKKIWGLKVGFANPDDAERYKKWIEEIIEGGKSDEVKAYEKAKKEKEIKERVESAKKTIEKAEMQKDIPAKKEAERRMKRYNDAVNDGGFGYVPYIISAEEYEYAKEIVTKYGN